MKKTFGEYLIEMYGENAIELYWSDKNILSPHDYSYGSKKYVWINCIESKYHGSFITRPSRYVAGHGCPCCVGQKTHPKDSFAQWGIDNICEDFLEKYWSKENIVNPYEVSYSSGMKIKIICQEKEYHGSYEIIVAAFTKGCRCGYCYGGKTHKQDSIGFLYPELLELFSDKNKISLYELKPHSSKKVLWKCENGIHEDYKRPVSKNIFLGFRCPECSKINRESSLEKLTKEFLEEIGYKYFCEYNCNIVPKNPKNKHGLPFDVEVDEIKLIIEVHGGQHYNLLPKHNTWTGGLSPEQYLHKLKLYDRYKRLIAHINNYHYLEIPYWEFDDETYKQTILNEIIRIKGEKI